MISADVQGPIVESLGHIRLLPWIGIGFPLGSVATTLLTASLYDRFEIKWMYLASTMVFAVGSVVCGAAPTIDALIIGRVIAGIGGAGRYLGNLRYFGNLASLENRAAYFAGLGIFFGIGAILGPAIGGVFASSSPTWRWSFYINVVLTAVIVPALIILPRHNPQPHDLALAKVRTIDWVGGLLNTTILALFVVGLTLAGNPSSWSTPRIIIILALALLAVLALAVQQGFAVLTTADQRLFTVGFLKNRTIMLMFLDTATTASAMFFTIHYIPLFFQFTRGD